jgi:hypothetical protein
VIAHNRLQPSREIAIAAPAGCAGANPKCNLVSSGKRFREIETIDLKKAEIVLEKITEPLSRISTGCAGTGPPLPLSTPRKWPVILK